MIDLYDHQRSVLNRLRSGSVLVGGVGSGKSRTALAYYFYKECFGKIAETDEQTTYMRSPKDLYIITTAKKRDDSEWIKECIPFLLIPDENPYGVRIIVDSWNNIGKYCNVCGAFFVFDEQRVVGSGKWVRSFLQITKKNHWILLSATPGDKWEDYIPVFIANGFYKNRTDFIRQHIVYNSFVKYPKVEQYLSVGRLSACRNQILVYMDFKSHVARHTKLQEFHYDEKLYEQIAIRRWNYTTDMPIQGVSELFYLLRRVSNESDYRVEMARQVICGNPKLIVFYNFDYELEILREIGSELGITVAEWNGHKHMPVPTNGNWLYLVQYNSGAEGWNCITTNTMMFYSLNYSYKMMLQASGRIDRLNTPFSDLFYYVLISDAPIDKLIIRSLRLKEDFNIHKVDPSLLVEKRFA